MNWTPIRNYLSSCVGVKPQLLDYIAVYDILKLCCEGKSNSRIANELDEPQFFIQQIIEEFFQFGGFKNDLDFNVRVWYSKHKYNKYLYMQTARSLDLTSTTEDLRKSFDINKIFEIIERKINEYYFAGL